MIAAPAVDLRGGRCVQLVGGRPAEERVSLPDPVAAAGRWAALGFRTLHVVDLDAALGEGDNRETVGRLLETWEGDLQVGGGVRDESAVAALLEAGAARVVVGTRGVRDRAWLARVSEAHPGRVVLAADVRGREVLVRGWTEGSGLGLEALLESVVDLPLGGILCTDVDREGRMEGVDPGLPSTVAGATGIPAWISGGIRSLDDLEAVEAAGAAGAVLGMALYTGRLDAHQVAVRWGGAAPEEGANLNGGGRR